MVQKFSGTSRWLGRIFTMPLLICFACTVQHSTPTLVHNAIQPGDLFDRQEEKSIDDLLNRAIGELDKKYDSRNNQNE
jgi:hypothetical protein